MIKSNSNIEEKRAFEFTLEGFNKEGRTFWHYFEIPVNIFQKLCLEWWGGEMGERGDGSKQGVEVKVFFQKLFRVRDWRFFASSKVAADD